MKKSLVIVFGMIMFFAFVQVPAEAKHQGKQIVVGYGRRAPQPVSHMRPIHHPMMNHHPKRMPPPPRHRMRHHSIFNMNYGYPHYSGYGGYYYPNTTFYPAIGYPSAYYPMPYGVSAGVRISI